MTKEKYETIIIDHCEQCGGTWLDPQELSKAIESTKMEHSDEAITSILNHQRSTKALNEHKKNINCPKCHEPMKTIQFAGDTGVYIERCVNGHGHFLDRGELSNLEIISETRLMKRGQHPRQLNAAIKGEKTCPRDHTKLDEIRVNSEAIDYCPSCSGIWCDHKELRGILNIGAKNKNTAEKPTVAKPFEIDLSEWLNCTVCNAPMIRVNYSGSSDIFIDRCPNDHGVWLDKSELERLINFQDYWKSALPKYRESLNSLLAAIETKVTDSYNNSVDEGTKSILKHSIPGRLYYMLKEE